MNNIKYAINKNIRKNGVRFYMPGHKGRNRFMGRLFSKKQLYYDVTELDETDNLHLPKGPILRAQNQAAQAFGAKHTFFLVNGSTAGIYAMIGACCRAGDSIIVDRGCHISVINAVILFGLKPIYLMPEYDETFGVYSHIEPKKLGDLLHKNPDVKAVVITSPTYYGRCSNIKELARISHLYGAALLVDEAHGAHLCFSNILPPSAMQSGADCAVQSAHKTLPCVTQCAYMHLNSNLISKDRITEQLDFFQTSSPSYLFMLALENAAYIMKNKGQKELNRLIKQCDKLCDAVEETGKVKCLRDKMQDKTRLVLNFSPINTKAEVIANLLKKQGIYIEMAEGFNLVCIATINNTNRDIKRFQKAIIKILKRFPKVDATHSKQPPPIPKVRLLPQRAYYLPSLEVDAEKAVGNVASRAVYQVPPGIPLVCPGEIVQPYVLKHYQRKIMIINENGD